jgi:Fur family ferric uptake transcriptional regulator
MSAQISTNSSIELLKIQFADFLKKKMYRNTQERFLVLEKLAELDRHFSADELYIIINSSGLKISRATIYSTLDLLTKCNILTKHRFQGESAHFELSSRKPNHDHLICVECGHIIEFNEEQLYNIGKNVCNKFDFIPMKYSMQIFGVCKDINTCEFNK